MFGEETLGADREIGGAGPGASHTTIAAAISSGSRMFSGFCTRSWDRGELRVDRQLPAWHRRQCPGGDAET